MKNDRQLRDKTLEETIRLATFSDLLRWSGRPAAFSHNGSDELEMVAGPETDLFCDPRTGTPVSNAPRLLVPLKAEAVLQARVSVEFQATFDAGVLVLWADAAHWAKLCFEQAPDERPMVVSVVNRGVSDDSNAFVVEEAGIYLRVARLGTAYAFHASPDGRRWSLIRYFSLGPVEKVQVGFSAQSPQGASCRVRFSEIAFEERTLEDIRSGV